MTTTIRLGTASPASQATSSATIEYLEQIARRAASQSIDILLLPEAFIGGYPRGTAFGCSIGNRTTDGREEFAKYFEQAVDLGDTVGEGNGGAGVKWLKRELEAVRTGGGDANDSAGDRPTRGDGTRERLEGIARDTGVFIVVGCIERAGGSLYCAAVYVCPKEGIIGKRRKVMPTGSERLIWAQGSPSTLRAVSTTIRGTRINLAAAICWENYMPLLRQSLYAQNVNLYLAPTADGRDSWLSLMRTVGLEGRCFVVSSNMCIESPPNGQASTANSATNAADGVAGRKLRRNSTITEDGFEIALPNPSQPPPPQSKRRKSIFDDDGNEIVLCGAASDGIPPSRGSARDASASTSLAETKTFVTRGGSCIVSPSGDVLQGPQWEDTEGLIYADVDFRDCIRGRLDFDAAGSYSRSDAFKFSVEGLNLDPLPY